MIISAEDARSMYSIEAEDRVNFTNIIYYICSLIEEEAKSKDRLVISNSTIDERIYQDILDDVTLYKYKFEELGYHFHNNPMGSGFIIGWSVNDNYLD